ncbi:MAG: glycosyltransferase family 39 protein, partial [Gaiellaceae bacterium]
MRKHFDAIVASRWLVPIALPLLVLLSLFIRSRQLHAGFWIDEGISVGISHEHWTSIPHLLREDGSPPLYYMLLGIWVRLFGDSEAATHTLSLVFGLACVPLAYFAARAVFGRRAGLAAAVLAALDPFLTYYAQETRMYELEALLSLVVAWSYVEAILRGRRWWLPVLVLST